MTKTSTSLGISSAIGVIFIWSGFIVFSRAGVVTSLTAFDISALRFMVAGVVVLPFATAWWPRHLPLHAIIIMSICGPGAAYSLLMYLGLNEVSAAYGGIFSNGTMPMFTIALTMLVIGQMPDRKQMIAISVIVIGGLLFAFRGTIGSNENVTSGTLMFLSASAILSVYIFGLKHWLISPRQALVLVTLPNAALFLPVWLFFLPSGLSDTDPSMVVFQALFQGLGPGFLAVILFALAVKHLGPNQTAGISAAVPASAAVLAIPVLSEMPTPVEWAGIAIVTAGLVMLLIPPAKTEPVRAIDG